MKIGELKKDEYIFKMATKASGRNPKVYVPLLVSYTDTYGREIEGFSESTKRDDDTTLMKDVALSYAILDRSESPTEHVYEIVISAMEYTKVVNAKGETVGKPVTRYYTLLTSHQKELIEEVQVLKSANTPIPKELLNVKLPSEYLNPVNWEYSEALERYLTNNGEFEISDFTDLAYPVVEHARPTLVKASVQSYLAHGGDLAGLADNANLVVESLQTKYTPVKFVGKQKEYIDMVMDVREAFNNYLNSVADVFSILSARKRGDNVSTTDILRSCPKLTNKDNILNQATPELRTSIFSNKLPLFSDRFMHLFLMGYIPLFLINDDSETEHAFFGCDLFKPFKEDLLRNMDVLKREIEKELTGDAKRILTQSEYSYDKCEMSGMYEEYLTKSRDTYSLSNIFDNKYSCYFVDMVVYIEALIKYTGAEVKDFKLFDFLNLISPVVLTRGGLNA